MIKYLTEKFIDKFGGQIIKMDDPTYQDFEIYALDPVWTRKFLNTNSETSVALLRLLAQDIRCVRQHVHITPKAVHFTALTNLRSLTSDHVRLIVDNVLKIAAAGECIAETPVTSEETGKGYGPKIRN